MNVTPISAFVVYVPEAEPCVGALRERFDASARLGAPAHITVLAPFMSPELVDGGVLERAGRALAAVPSFAFALTRVDRFPATAYLAPEPAAPFIALTKSLARTFPEYPPFGGAFESVVPHLTVAHGDPLEADEAARELALAMRARGPIRSRCASVALLQNASGRWKELHAFALPSLSARARRP